MKIFAVLPTFLAAACLTLAAGCSKRAQTELKIVSLDPRTLAIHEAALAAVIAKEQPEALFCLAAEVDEMTSSITSYSKDTESRILLAAKCPQKKLLPTTDIRVPADGEKEPSPSGGQRHAGLTSLSTKKRINAYMIDKILERSPTMVEVHWLSFCGPLDAYGGSMLLEFKDGVWHASHVRREWVS